jgi:hypothetical protein
MYGISVIGRAVARRASKRFDRFGLSEVPWTQSKTSQLFVRDRLEAVSGRLKGPLRFYYRTRLLHHFNCTMSRDKALQLLLGYDGIRMTKIS